MIDIVALRKKVIDLAIQGKLTQQLPEDGSAENLYAQIQEEKVKLIKEGKIKKEKLLPPISDDEVSYEIPSNWKWVRLGSCIELLSGQDFSPEGYNSDGFGLPYMTGASNIEDGKLIVNRWTEHPKNISCLGDLLLVCKGSGYGKLAINNVGDVHIARQFMAISAANDLMDLEYVKFYLSGSIMTIKSNGQGLIPGIDRPSVLNMFFPLPPLAEQKRIVEKIEEIFVQIDIIDTLQKQYEFDREILKGKIIDAGIRGELTEQLPEDGNAEELYAQIQEEKVKLIKGGKIKKEKPLPPISEDEIPFEIPKTWLWVRLANLGVTVTGNTPSKSVEEYYGGDYPFYKPADLDMGRHISIGSETLTKVGINESRFLKAGSILVCCIGTIGKVAIIDVDGACNQQINALSPLVSDSDYLLFVISGDCFQRQLQMQSRATTVSIIKKSLFDECIVPLPPLPEQKRIVDKIDALLACIEDV